MFITRLVCCLACSIMLAATLRTNQNGGYQFTQALLKSSAGQAGVNACCHLQKPNKERKVCHTRKAMTNLKADLLRHHSCFFLPNPLLLCKSALQTEMQVIGLPVSCICKPCFQTNLSHPMGTTMCYFNCDIQLIQKYLVDLGQNTHVLIHYIFSTQL